MSNIEDLRNVAHELLNIADALEKWQIGPGEHIARIVLDAEAFEKLTQWLDDSDPPCTYDLGCPFGNNISSGCERGSGETVDCWREVFRLQARRERVKRSKALAREEGIE